MPLSPQSNAQLSGSDFAVPRKIKESDIAMDIL
jgi:hypothetical protein